MITLTPIVLLNSCVNRPEESAAGQDYKSRPPATWDDYRVFDHMAIDNKPTEQFERFATFHNFEHDEWPLDLEKLKLDFFGFVKNKDASKILVLDFPQLRRGVLPQATIHQALSDLSEMGSHPRCGLNFGFFSTIPTYNFSAAISDPNSKDFIDWTIEYKDLLIASNKTDFLFPALLTATEDRQDWTRMAERVLEIAKLENKPIIPILSPLLLESDHHAAQQPTYVSEEFWAHQLVTVYNSCEGAMIYLPAPPGQNQNDFIEIQSSNWWSFTRRYLEVATLTNPRPAGPLAACRTVNWPMPLRTKLDYLESMLDPVYGTRVTRISGDEGKPIPGTSFTWGKGLRQGYPKDPVWNADQSLMCLKVNWGTPSLLFFHGNSYLPAFGGSAPFAKEIRWHPTRPNDMLYISKDDEIGYWDVRAKRQTVIKKFSPEYTKCFLGPYEGNISNDGKLVAVNAWRSSDNKQVVFAFDLETTYKYPDIVLEATVVLDWGSISPLGTYIVINANFTGQSDQTQVYDLLGKKVGALWDQPSMPTHYDLAVTRDNVEVAVGSAKFAPYRGMVIRRNLSDGKIMALTQAGWPSHVSARNFKQPGWAFALYRGTQASTPSWPPYWNELVAVCLDGTKALRICHFYCSAPSPQMQGWHGAFATPAPNGRKAVFCSDWDGLYSFPQTYIVDFCDNLRVTK